MLCCFLAALDQKSRAQWQLNYWIKGVDYLSLIWLSVKLISWACLLRLLVWGFHSQLINVLSLSCLQSRTLSVLLNLNLLKCCFSWEIKSFTLVRTSIFCKIALNLYYYYVSMSIVLKYLEVFVNPFQFLPKCLFMYSVLKMVLIMRAQLLYG
jgi:hypothetical protein